MTEPDYLEAGPNASAIIESLRAVGYSPQTAIADLIDNSVSAHATNVNVKFWWDGKDSWVAIIDDGAGMDPERLTNAMRPGTMGPYEPRDPSDLGRFGLGLKTASFSQCRKLTVASKPLGGVVAYRTWDLDYVRKTNQWRLLTKPDSKTLEHLSELDDMASGTIVLWESMDRLAGESHADNQKAMNRFLEVVDDVEDHLSMVFHRLIAEPNPRMQITIDCGSGPQALVAWDPFMEHHPATDPTPEEPIVLADGIVRVRGFVLPHATMLTGEEHSRAGGHEGWNARQGFYIYRNDRLVVAGSWLGLGQGSPWTREEHYKLARIRIDIPNSMDLAWHLDVKKSDARPPNEIRERLKSLALHVRTKAKNVFSHRGAIGPRGKGESIPPVWMKIRVDGHPAYKLDRSHPLVKRVRNELAPEARTNFSALLAFMEQTVPIHRIWLDMSEEPEAHSGPFEHSPDDEVLEVASALFKTMTEDQGLTDIQARDRLRAMEVFGAFVERL